MSDLIANATYSNSNETEDIMIYVFIGITTTLLLVSILYSINPQVSQTKYVEAMNQLAPYKCQEQNYESDFQLDETNYEKCIDFGYTQIDHTKSIDEQERFRVSIYISCKRLWTIKFYKNYTTGFYNSTSGNVTCEVVKTEQEQEKECCNEVCKQFYCDNTGCYGKCLDCNCFSQDEILYQQDFLPKELGIDG